MKEPASNPGSVAAEISQDHWSRFLDEFSKDHAGAPARVQVRGTDSGGAHQLCGSMPLVGITYSAKDRPELIEIILEQSPEGANLTHVVPQPVHVWHHSDQSRCQLQVEAGDGTTTVVELLANAPSR